jgi:hypothetical protein
VTVIAVVAEHPKIEDAAGSAGGENISATFRRSVSTFRPVEGSTVWSFKAPSVAANRGF